MSCEKANEAKKVQVQLLDGPAIAILNMKYPISRKQSESFMKKDIVKARLDYSEGQYRDVLDKFKKRRQEGIRRDAMCVFLMVK